MTTYAGEDFTKRGDGLFVPIPPPAPKPKIDATLDEIRHMKLFGFSSDLSRAYGSNMGVMISCYRWCEERNGYLCVGSSRIENAKLWISGVDVEMFTA